MRKTEMSKAQLGRRQRIAAALVGAGWKTMQEHRDLEMGLWEAHEAALEFRGRTLSASFYYDAAKERVYLLFKGRGGMGVGLNIRFGDGLDQLLAAIARDSGRISVNGYKDLVRDIVTACPETYTPAGKDEKLVRVVDKSARKSAADEGSDRGTHGPAVPAKPRASPRARKRK